MPPWLFAVLLLVLVVISQGIDSRQPGIRYGGTWGCRTMPEYHYSQCAKAIDLGVTTLEMDAVISKDKQVVVSHDPFFSHDISTRPDGSEVTSADETLLNIYQMNFEDVKRYDVGIKANPRFPRQQKMKASKPRLTDLIDSVEWYCKKNGLSLPNYNIETKSLPAGDGKFHPAPGEFVELLMSTVRSKGIQERVIIQSFDFRTIQ